jgi:subtilisin family serine protease
MVVLKILKIRLAVASLACAFACSISPATAQAPPPQKTVTDESQLPRFSYPMPVAPSVLIVSDDATFAPFAATVGADVDKTLRDYDIQDKASLRDLISTKLALQVLAHDETGARQTIAQLRAAETKADLQLLAGRLYLDYFDALAQTKGGSASQMGDAFAAVDRKQVDALPWGVVQDSMKEIYAGESVATKDSLLGFVKHDLDPIAAKTGTLDGPSARLLVQLRARLLVTLPLIPADLPILQAYIAQHDVTKPDIWDARDVTLTPSQVKAPVLIGIWDSGVDPSDYPTAMFVDSSGRHGLAFADDGAPSPSYVYPLPPATLAKYPQDVSLLSGLSDLQSGINSPGAQAAQKYLRSLSPDQEEAFEADLDLVGQYSHGSHVAGIASRGNPGARIVVARFDDDLPNLAFEPTPAWARTMSANFAQISAYFRANHVRVVNMSWADNVAEFEQWLAKTDKNSDPQTRKQKAQELYAIWRSAVENVIKSTPGTLFVAAAGNADNDASFAAEVPASLSYPNLITVGAVNQAGDATSFTSYGPTVAVYADGYHVASKIPGGYVVKFSGTSMASPNVSNLAAKLFALDPSLTPEQVRALIVKGATRSDDGKLPLIDPQRSVELLHSSAAR